MKPGKKSLHFNKKKSSLFIITLLLLISLTTQVFALTYTCHPMTVDNSGSVGRGSSIAIVNGYPAISYFDGDNYQLKYVRANDANGTSWGIPQAISHVSWSNSLQIVEGRPAIAFFDNGERAIMFIRANDENGTSWPDTPTRVNVPDMTAYSLTMAVVNGYPAMSYRHWPSGNLQFVRATSTDGSTWGTPLTVDDSGNLCSPTTLIVAAGNPAISYRDGTNDQLKYIRANDASGTTWPSTPVTVDADGDTGRNSSMAVVDGSPAIAYWNSSTNTLKFVRATSSDGSTWGTPQTLANVGHFDQTISLSVINGAPAISYNDTTYEHNALRFIQASNASGTSWHARQTLDSGHNMGWPNSMTEVNGQPGISYYDYDNANLKFVLVQSADISVYDGAAKINNNEIIDLGTTTVNNPISQTLTIYNDGYSTLNLSNLTVPSGFSLVGNFADEIAPGSNGNITIRMDAYTTNNYNVDGRTFLIYSNDSRFRIIYTGVITEALGEIAVFDGATEITDGTSDIFDFGTTTVGTPVSHTFTVENTSTEDLNLYSLSLPSGFSLQGTYDSTVPAGDSTDITVRLDAISVGSYSGEFSLANNDADENPFNFPISGEVLDTSGEIAMFDGLTGIADGETTPIDFGTTALGTPVSRTFTIQNYSSNNLDIYALTLPSGFSLQGSYNHVVAPSSSTTITVQLDASFVGSYSGEFSLANDDNDENPFNFAISGEVNNTTLETDIIVPLNGSTVLESGIQVAFNHDVLHDGSAEAADNPVNYLLVEDGANGLFDTSTCLAGVVGDDIQQTITGVTYDASNYIATINTDPLPAGRYQLLVCGTASIEDATGNVLNGGAFDSTTAFTVVSANTGGDSALSALLPATGFTPQIQTVLPTQPADLAYNHMDSLTLQIPSLKVDVPIVGVPQNNTGWDVTWLTNAQAGWLNGTAYPTWDGNTVLTGHVTNASGNPGPFAEIKTLKFGDQITIQAYGETYTYLVRENKLTTRDDMSIIEEHKSRDWVTLITCEYFNENTGEYLFRRVVRAVLVEVE